MAIYTGTHIGYTIPGTVEAVGSAVTTVRPGDRVGGSSPIADRAVVDAVRGRLAPLPEGVSFEQGCLALQSVVGMQGIRLADVRLGERVAVFGQGLIGQFARQIAALAGAVMTMAIDPIDARLEAARRHGATHLVHPGLQDVAAVVAEATEGIGVDVAIEATGHPPVILDALQVAARLGRVILLGSPRGRIEIDPYSDIHRKGVRVIGAASDTAADAPNGYYRWTEDEHFRLALELIRQGRLRTDGLISHRIAATEALGLFDRLAERPQDCLGVLVRWD